MAFSDIFSPERLGAAFSDPRVQLGLQMMAAGGQQPGNPTLGQRFAQAGQGFAQQQLDQQQQQQLNALRQMQVQQAQQQATSAQQLAERMRDPAFAATLPPHSRRLAEAGASPDQVFRVYEMESQLQQQQAQQAATQQHRAAQLAQQQQPLIDARTAAANRSNQAGAPAGPKAPAMRQTIDQPLANGMVQRHIYDPSTGGYVPFGEPYQRGQAAQGADPLAQLLGEIPTGSPKSGAPGVTAGHIPLGAATAPMRQGADLLTYGVPQGGQPQPPAARPAPSVAAAGGGQAQAGSMSDFQRDLAQAQQLVQANPALRDEVNRRLMQAYGRGL